MMFSLFRKSKNAQPYMMVKGTAVKATSDFVKNNFPKHFDQWLDILPEESKIIYSKSIEIPKWYSMKYAYLIPIEKITEMFFDNDHQKAGEAMGAYAAEVALKGVYKLFLSVATTSHIVSRSTSIIKTFFDPCRVKVVDKAKNTITVQITEFPETSLVAEYRIGAWCKKAIEMTNAGETNYEMIASMSKGDKRTAFKYTWQ